MTGVDPRTIRCRHFPECKRKDCVFSHDQKALPSNICRYFLEGTCLYEENCRFEHKWWDPDSETTSRDTNVGTSDRESTSTSSSNSAIRSHHYSQKSHYTNTNFKIPSESENGKKPLCPFASIGTCTTTDCQMRHGDLCDICQCQVLDRDDEAQRTAHEKDCLQKAEKEMAFAFALQRGADVQCNVCMDIVMKKSDENKRRFALQSGCEHSFCFDCVMKWRTTRVTEMQEEHRRTCPLCRKHSDYVIPSRVWPETKEEKEQIMKDIKEALKQKPCRRFDEGRKRCPFGSDCWYKHAMPDGTLVQLPPPRRRNARNRFLHLDYDEYEFIIDMNHQLTLLDELVASAGLQLLH